jgi:hypothetical protein
MAGESALCRRYFHSSKEKASCSMPFVCGRLTGIAKGFDFLQTLQQGVHTIIQIFEMDQFVLQT